MKIDNVLCAFEFNGEPVSCQEFGKGRINSTFMIQTDTGKAYVLQLINKRVFKDPVKLMENASRVTNYLLERTDGCYTTLRYMQTKSGTYCHQDEQGEYWRMYEFVPGIGLDAPDSDEDLYQCALAFGWFQNLLADFPADSLHETIPCFHNTIDRYQKLKESIAADVMGRADSVRAEIDYLLSREEIAGTIQRKLDSGELPLRVTHNDTKLNNVLLDPITHQSVCVLDLDTVLPGSSLYDYGDSVRFGAANGGEDAEDPSLVSLNLHLFEVYTKGYLEAVTSLTEKEIDLLPIGALVITLELATRFLKDYLDGDIYFKIKEPHHNLLRARNQIALAQDMEQKMTDMEAIVRSLRRTLSKCSI
ncbi:MAG: aminoglycoside phosphotransferase family protein [Oscillospiraceae bacterium]|nr:aminoglycoside phosphotransferase family protein [Oscillospiraceae bacterium]